MFSCELGVIFQKGHSIKHLWTDAFVSPLFLRTFSKLTLLSPLSAVNKLFFIIILMVVTGVQDVFCNVQNKSLITNDQCIKHINLIDLQTRPMPDIRAKTKLPWCDVNCDQILL